MTETAVPTPRRPVVVTIAVVLTYVTAFADVGAGLLILLSRYQAPRDAVLAVSLLGAGIILLGLLTVAIASGVARGSRLARLLVTVYAAFRLALHLLTIVSTDWDAVVLGQIVVDAFVIVVLWAPPGRRWFRPGVTAARA